MKTLRGIIKRVIRREGRVGRIWLKNSETARSVNRLSSAPYFQTRSPAATGYGIPPHEHGIAVNKVSCFDQSGLG